MSLAIKDKPKTELFRDIGLIADPQYFNKTDLTALTTLKPTLRPDVKDGNIIFHYSIAQNTPEWDALRAGKITASAAAPLLVSSVTSKGKQTAGSIGPLSKGAVTICKKVARQVYEPSSGIGEDRFYGGDMARGHIQEDQAAIEFMSREGLELEACGFVSRWNIGASPDMLVKGHKIGYETKSANADIHWSRLLDPISFDKEHFAQCQFSMFVSGYHTWYLTSFNPTFKGRDRLLVRVIERDEVMMATFASQVREANDLVLRIIEKKPIQ